MIENYIRKSLSNFPEEFVNCVVRAMQQIQNMCGYGESLPVSVILYVAAKKYHLKAEICMGILEVQGKEICSAWCKVENTIIDLAVFGLTNYCSDFTEQYHWFFEHPKMIFSPMPTPFIGTENAAALHNLKYREGDFDQDWNWADIKQCYGTYIATYIINAPQDCIMKRLAEVLGEEPTIEFAEGIYQLVQADRVGIRN